MSGTATLPAQMLVCSSNVYIINTLLLPAATLATVPNVLAAIGGAPPLPLTHPVHGHVPGVYVADSFSGRPLDTDLAATNLPTICKSNSQVTLLRIYD